MERLKARRDFLRTAKGRKWAAPGLVLQARARRSAAEEPDDLRVGYTVTKKVGKAHTRNRAKRRLRAAAADILPRDGRSGYDYVLVGRAGTLTRTYPDLLADLELALTKVHSARGNGARADKQR